MMTYINLIISAVITTIVGFWIRRYLEKINSLTFSYLTATRGKITHPNIATADHSFHINTHTLIITNPNERLVTNVQVVNYLPRELIDTGHQSIGDIITIFPIGDYEIKKSKNNLAVEEIYFPKLIPKQSVTITYMYPPPVDFSKFNITVSSDDGVAKLVPYAPQKIFPKWLSVLFWFLIITGSIVVINFVLKLIPVINYLLQIGNYLHN